MNLTKSPALTYGAAPRVNLLPPRERHRREQSALIRRWGTAALAAVALVVVAVLAAMMLERSASDDLKTEQARTATLATQLSSYADVSAASRDKGSYEAYRAQAMASDVAWKNVVGALQAALPTGVSITGFDATVGAGATDANGASTTQGSTAAGSGALATTAPSGTAVTATVQVTSMQPVDQTAMIGSFGKVAGVIGVDMGSLTSASSASYTSTTTVYFDHAALSGRYAKAAQ